MSDSVAQPHEGSSLYYSLWGVADPGRTRTLARLALGQALMDALLDVATPEVAHKKLHWWHEELERLHQGQARHPNTKACRDLAGDDKARDAALDVLGAAADERYTPAATMKELDERLARGYGGLLALCEASLAGTSVTETRDALSPLAVGLGHHHRLTHLPRLLAAGQPVFPNELYERHGTEPASLISTSSDTIAAADQALLADAIAHATTHLEAGISNADAQWPNRSDKRAIVVLARLRLRQLESWAKRRTALHREGHSLPPILKLWIAWRTR